MKTTLNALLGGALVAFSLLATTHADAQSTPLVDAAWLQKTLATGDVLVLDTQPAKLHEAGHIPGAVPVDLFAYGQDESDPLVMQQRIRSWGVSPGRRVVVVDQGGSYNAPRLFYELLYRGHPLEQLHLLDGGMAQWRATGGPVTQEKTPVPAPGSFTVRNRTGVRADLPETLAAAGDPQRHALVDALDPEMYYGSRKFFDRAGHLPTAVSTPPAEYFNADKTFKSAAQIRAMASHLGIQPDEQVIAYCGGGIAAAVPFFALHMIAGYPQVKLYVGSQLEWVRDSRELPLWSYAAPHLVRNAPWLASWTNPMLRAYGVTQINIVDVRSAEAFAAGHIPTARNLPASALAVALKQPAAVRPRLEAEGLQPTYETVIVSERGLDRAAALAFVALQSAGVAKVSVLATGTDEWALRGLPWDKQSAAARPTRLADSGRTVTASLADVSAPLPRVYIASGATPPNDVPAGQTIHLPASRLVNEDGSVKPAGELWAAISKAGVPRYAQLVFVADDVGDAAINYYVFQLMGYTDLRVLPR